MPRGPARSEELSWYKKAAGWLLSSMTRLPHQLTVVVSRGKKCPWESTNPESVSLRYPGRPSEPPARTAKQRPSTRAPSGIPGAPFAAIETTRASKPSPSRAVRELSGCMSRTSKVVPGGTTMAETAARRHSVSVPTITQAAAPAASITAAIVPRPDGAELENRFTLFPLTPSPPASRHFGCQGGATTTD